MQYFVQQLGTRLTLGFIHRLIGIGCAMACVPILFFIPGALFYSRPVVVVLLVMLIASMTLVGRRNIEKVACGPLRGSLRLASLITGITHDKPITETIRGLPC